MGVEESVDQNLRSGFAQRCTRFRGDRIVLRGRAARRFRHPPECKSDGQSRRNARFHRRTGLLQGAYSTAASGAPQAPASGGVPGLARDRLQLDCGTFRATGVGRSVQRPHDGMAATSPLLNTRCVNPPSDNTCARQPWPQAAVALSCKRLLGCPSSPRPPCFAASLVGRICASPPAEAAIVRGERVFRHDSCRWR